MFLRFQYRRKLTMIDACRAMGDEPWLKAQLDALELLQRINALWGRR